MMLPEKWGNREEIPFHHNETNSLSCPVTTALFIYQHAFCLPVMPTDLANYTPISCSPLYITDSLVTTQLFCSVQTGFHMDSMYADSLKWTTHSIWITAANLLQRQGFAYSFIQTQLWWESTSFLMYLCNTTHPGKAYQVTLSDNKLPPTASWPNNLLKPHKTMFHTWYYI